MWNLTKSQSKILNCSRKGFWNYLYMFNNLANQVILFIVDLSREIAPFLGQGGGGGRVAAISGKISDGNITLIVVAFFIFSFFIIGMALGRSKIMISIVSLYIAYFLENTFPYQKEVSSYFSNYDPYLIRIVLFLIFYILILLFLNKSVLRSRFSVMETPFFTILFISLIKAGLMISILLTYVPTDVVRSYSSLLLDYFGTSNARFLWAVLPIISFIFVRRRSPEKVTQ